MEPKNLEINGYEVVMKLMDESYIMCEDERSQNIKIDLGCRSISPRWPNPLFSTYYRMLLKAYNVGPVMLWLNKRIVGFLPMTVTGCGIPQLPLCIHYTGGITYAAEKHVDLKMIQRAEPTPFDQLDPKEIRIGCMAVHHTLRGQSISALMIQYMIDWAKENGWDRITARVMLDGEPMSYYPTESFWVRIGFNPVGRVRSFGLTDDPYDRAKSIELEYDLKK